MIKMDYPLFSLLLLLIYYMIWITESKTISFNRSGESIVIKSQDSSSNNYKLNWLLQTCITDVEEIIMGLDPEPVDDDDQLFHLLNCEDMGMFLNTLQGYHRQLTEFPITSLENNNSEMNKWFKRTEGMIRKHLAKLQSDCTPSLDLQDIMDNFLDCLLNKGRSMWEGAQNGNDEDSLLEEQRLKSILIALKLRITTPRQSEEPQELQNPYEHVGEIFLVLDSHMREVPATFLSVALGSRLIQRGWEHFNTSSSLVRTLTSALSPAILRMGGSSANYLTYDPEATTKKHFPSCQDIDGLQLEDLDPFNVEDMYDSNLDGNPFNLDTTHDKKQQLSGENLFADENRFNEYYNDNRNLHDDSINGPYQANLDNFATDLESKTLRFETSGYSKLSNDPFNILRDALSNSNMQYENREFNNMGESNNGAQSSNKIRAKKFNGMSNWDKIFDMSQGIDINHVSENHENRITSSLFPFQPFNKVNQVVRETDDNVNVKFSTGLDNLYDTDNLRNKKIRLQNRNSRYWSQDQQFEEGIPGYQLRRFRRNLDSSHQYPLTDFLSRRSNSGHDFYDNGVKHLYKDKQSNNHGSRNEHDWVYHHGMIHNHDLREHLESIDSNTDFPDIEIENNEQNYQHIPIPKYDEQGCFCEYLRANFTNFTMIEDDLNNLLEFVDAVNMTLLWDMNQFYREADGGWDPTNARMIIEEVSKKSHNVIWQLGNEPNSYAHHTHFSITGRQDALDFGVFRRELLSVFPEVTIVGPDTTRPRIEGNRISDALGFKSDPVVFLRDFLTYGNQDVDVISWHQYYADGRTSTLEDFMDPNLMDVLIKQLDTMVAVRDELAPNKPIWLTETSSAYGGGAPKLSNRYVAGFLWMDKLGLSARMGVDVVARQTLYHGSYALLDEYLNPLPDYWLSVIYKRQVGGKVLDIQLSTSTPTVRLYAHCLNPTSQHYKQGGVVVYGMNVGDKGASVSLQGHLNETRVLEMILQPTEGDLQSSSVMLNGVLVELTSQNDLPSLNAHPSNVLGALHMPAQSMGFWLLPNAKAQVCH